MSSPQISMQEFLDDVRIMRQWGSREDQRVAVEMAYTLGYAQARLGLGGYVDKSDASTVIAECGTLEKLIRMLK